MVCGKYPRFVMPHIIRPVYLYAVYFRAGARGGVPGPRSWPRRAGRDGLARLLWALFASHASRRVEAIIVAVLPGRPADAG